MGTGIWSMHFVGMLAFSLPIPLGYAWPDTGASLAIAVLVSYFALTVVARTAGLAAAARGRRADGRRDRRHALRGDGRDAHGTRHPLRCRTVRRVDRHRGDRVDGRALDRAGVARAAGASCDRPAGRCGFHHGCRHHRHALHGDGGRAFRAGRAVRGRERGRYALARDDGHAVHDGNPGRHAVADPIRCAHNLPARDDRHARAARALAHRRAGTRAAPLRADDGDAAAHAREHGDRDRRTQGRAGAARTGEGRAAAPAACARGNPRATAAVGKARVDRSARGRCRARDQQSDRLRQCEPQHVEDMGA